MMEAILSLTVLILACWIFYAIETWHDIDLEDNDEPEAHLETDDPEGPHQKD